MGKIKLSSSGQETFASVGKTMGDKKFVPKAIAVGLDIFDGLWVPWRSLLKQMNFQHGSQKITPRVSI